MVQKRVKNTIKVFHFRKSHVDIFSWLAQVNCKRPVHSVEKCIEPVMSVVLCIFRVLASSTTQMGEKNKELANHGELKESGKITDTLRGGAYLSEHDCYVVDSALRESIRWVLRRTCGLCARRT